MTELSQKAQECLREAGWTPGRSLDAQRIEETYRRAGFDPSRAAIEFMRRFGDLSLTYIEPRGRQDGCEFMLKDAVAGKPHWLWDHERVIGARLTPIGWAHWRHYKIMMTEDGRIFGAYDDFIVLVGNDGHDAINALCEGRKLEHVEYVSEPIDESVPASDFTAVTTECLRRADWFEGRDIGSRAVDESAVRWQIRLSEMVRTFLLEFGGLRIFYPSTHPDGLDSGCDFDFDAAMGQFPRWCLKDCSRIAGEDLLPIGCAAKKTVTLLMSDRGAVYGGMKEVPEMLKLVGRTPVEALNVLCEGRMWRDIQ
jgi:hypothetical protein